jgi:CheY-like chemotaxis protein
MAIAQAKREFIGGAFKSSRACVVLVVEDDDDARATLAELLDDAGYVVLAAPNGAAALSLLRAPPHVRTPPCDVVILDLMMPIMNGWDFRANQRADPCLSHIPVLLMSSRRHIAAVSDELETADYISKPIAIPDLLNKLARLRPDIATS